MALTGSELSYGTFELCAPGMEDSYETAEMLSEVSDERSLRCRFRWTNTHHSCLTGRSVTA